MPDRENDFKPHISVGGYYTNEIYQYPKKAMGPEFRVIQQDRATHGRYLKNQLDAIRSRFKIENETPLPENIVRDDTLYVEFISEWGAQLKLESLDSDSQDRDTYQLLNVREEKRDNNGQEEFRSLATVLLREGGISKFLKKIDEYLSKNTTKKNKETGIREDTGKPKNEPLINNIQSIQMATLKAFWTDAPEIPFPQTEDSIWWEVWFRKTTNDGEKLRNVYQNLQTLGCLIGASGFELPEHRIKLIKGTVGQLSQSLLLLDNLAELRKPQQISDFIFGRAITYQDNNDYLKDLIRRTEKVEGENEVLVCLFDSGVNNRHALLAPFLPDTNLYSYKEDWGKTDSAPREGHGTGVASLALYGDLTDVLATGENIQIYHGLESYKIFHPNDPNDPILYAAMSEEAANTPLIDRPSAIRIYCMTILDKDRAFRGRPSSWSSAIDKITFGSSFEPRYPQLFIMSGGNAELHQHEEYPDKNYLESIHDPAQAYNAITVGSYTRKDRIPADRGLRALAPNGGMAPSNSTSLTWERQWPNKPDIVMEGGNCSTDGVSISDDDTLKLIAADAGYPNHLFCPFGDTSASAALASRLAARLRVEYPNFWPETIRGLMIHSAEWTDAMLENKNLSGMNGMEKRNILRCFGYGVPDLESAMYSANSSVTLIAEREIRPYKLEESTVKYNHYQLFELPWPTQVLRDLQETDVTLTVTLSYYIEPNPGNKRYINNYQYHSHSLDFALIKPSEPIEVFKRRVSASSDLPAEDQDNTGEKWLIGKSVGSKGSIRKDLIHTSAVELSTRNILAIYPKNGWYRTRKLLKMYDKDVRYSLIVTIKTAEADLYTPVFELVNNLLTI